MKSFFKVHNLNNAEEKFTEIFAIENRNFK